MQRVWYTIIMPIFYCLILKLQIYKIMQVKPLHRLKSFREIFIIFKRFRRFSVTAVQDSQNEGNKATLDSIRVLKTESENPSKFAHAHISKCLKSILDHSKWFRVYCIRPYLPFFGPLKISAENLHNDSLKWLCLINY